MNIYGVCHKCQKRQVINPLILCQECFDKMIEDRKKREKNEPNDTGVQNN